MMFHTISKWAALSLVVSQLVSAGGDITPVEPVVDNTSVATQNNRSFSIFSNIKSKGEIRPRYEFVNTDNNVKDAKALTNRLKFGIGADLFNIDGLSTYMEAVNVSGSGDFYDTSSGDISDKGVYNTVVDPDQTRITQAYINYKYGNSNIRVGRQGINLDNQRFIGTVNWRQMPQTYDAVLLSNHSIEGLDLAASYVWKVHTVKKYSFDTGSAILHAGYKVSDALKLTGYAYLLEDIHDTYGVFATGKIGINETMALSYRAEYAQQKDPTLEDKTSGLTADADYYNLAATLHMKPFFAAAGYEVLGAGNDGNKPFYTPLATLHAHNGWADKFLGATPADGLVDMSATLGYKSSDFGLAKLVYHDFSSDKGSSDYGTEWDLLYKTKIRSVEGLSAMAKAALYKADDYSVDTTKYWLMLDYTF